MTTNKVEPIAMLSAYIAEYNSRREEQLKRVDSQNQIYNYLLIVLGVAASAIVASLNKPEMMPVIVCWITLLLPIISAPLGFIYFDHDLVIHSIGAHLHYIWRPNVTALLNTEQIFKNPLEFAYLHKSSLPLHKTLSKSRWFLFLVPTAVPILCIFIYTLLQGKWWNNYMHNLTPIQSWIVFIFGLIIWVTDLVASILIICAIRWTFVKNYWEEKSGESISNVEIQSPPAA
jgi:hypothetical protein